MIQSLSEMLIALPAIMIALTFHEYAHGKVADILGDSTPYYQGRLTLNPLPHIDWVGFFMLILFHFGWAKPVQVNPYNFKNVSPKQGMMLVFAGGTGHEYSLSFSGHAGLQVPASVSRTGMGNNDHKHDSPFDIY
jgi:Zn-dependent protease